MTKTVSDFAMETGIRDSREASAVYGAYLNTLKEKAGAEQIPAGKRHEYWSKVLEMDENCAPAWDDRGRVLSEMGRYKEAIRCYDRALKIEPANNDYKSDRASAVKEKRKRFWRSAITTFVPPSLVAAGAYASEYVESNGWTDWLNIHIGPVPMRVLVVGATALASLATSYLAFWKRRKQ